MKKRVFAALVTLAVYSGLVAWLTWPLAVHVSTHLPDTSGPCRFDTLVDAWGLSYQSRALVNDPARLIAGNIYHPAPHSISYGATSFGSLPYFAPPFLLTGNPALAVNLTFLGMIMLTAWMLHLVVVRWTGSQAAGFLAAWVLLTNRWVLWDLIPTGPHYAVLAYFPLIILLAAVPANRFRTALGLLPLVVLQALTDLVYLAPAVLLPLGLLAVFRLARPDTRGAGLRLLGVLALSVIVLSPFYTGYFVVSAENPELKTQTLWPGTQRPTALPWELFGRFYPTAVQPVALLLIAAGVLRFGLNARRRGEPHVRRAWSHGAFWALVGLVMSLTPIVHWYDVEITLPHAVLAQLVPLYGTLRAPARLGVAGLMGLAILSGIAFEECFRRVRDDRPDGLLGPLGRGGIALVLAAVMYVQYSLGVGVISTPPRKPLPPTYPIARAISDDSPLVHILREPGGPVLELPIGPKGTWPVFHAQAMYRSIFHGRSILNGYSSYWPAGFLRRMALANRLPDRAALATLRGEVGLEMILVHTKRLFGEQRQLWLAVTEHGGRDDIRVLARDGGDVLLSVTDDRKGDDQKHVTWRTALPERSRNGFPFPPDHE